MHVSPIKGEPMSKYSKALVAVAGAVVAVLAAVGINVDPAVSTAVVGAITSVLVLIVPNK